MKLLPILALTLFTTASLRAEEKQIFNGKDLTGWEGNLKLWSVEDGAITGRTGSDPETKIKHNTFLVWRGGMPGDFELTVKYRIVKGNSGIQYRSKELPAGENGPIISGYQADFDTGKTYTGMLYEEKGRGILVKRGEKMTISEDGKKEVVGAVGNSDEIQASVKPEDWNEYKIIAKGSHIQQFLNGKQTVDVVDEDKKKSAKEGLIALQIHVGGPMTVQFKEMVLKELK